MIEGFRRTRRVLDEFQPDFCLIWGDDQYENYRDDCVPAFSILAYDEVEVQPWLHNPARRELLGMNPKTKASPFVGIGRAASTWHRLC